MSDPFRENIRSALADANLQHALDGNAERRIAARQQAYASLSEDFQILRQRAHDVRAQTISRLDEYLTLFVDRARTNEITVHHAQTASHALEIIREIARQSDAKVIAKSKTMVGEEIHLNQALEADGLQVVETDLGEYIVQLPRRAPSPYHHPCCALEPATSRTHL